MEMFLLLWSMNVEESLHCGFGEKNKLHLQTSAVYFENSENSHTHLSEGSETRNKSRGEAKHISSAAYF